MADRRGFQETGGSRRKQAADAMEWLMKMVISACKGARADVFVYNVYYRTF
ncbi:hypothetical protein [Youngiibacter fragilis]|uniref:hypothetical protein n=1 Tax=Youngiibacter fragilis TaxID=1408819 RepID=UPI001A9A3990|nr:hypothetical protein [Youngiibacter fragilis]